MFVLFVWFCNVFGHARLRPHSMFVKAILVLEVEIFRPLCLLAQQCHSSNSAFCVKAISGAPLVKAMMVRRRHMIAKAMMKD